jgi:fatty acid desaturase
VEEGAKVMVIMGTRRDGDRKARRADASTTTDVSTQIGSASLPLLQHSGFNSRAVMAIGRFCCDMWKTWLFLVSHTVVCGLSVFFLQHNCFHGKVAMATGRFCFDVWKTRFLLCLLLSFTFCAY